MTLDEAARRSDLGLVVTLDGAVTWLNDAARELVEPHGGSWDGPSSPVHALREIRPGSRNRPLRWPPPVGQTRWWVVSCSELEPAQGLLWEIADETERFQDDHSQVGPTTAQWRLTHLEKLAGMGSWVWNLETDVIECSEALLEHLGLPPGTVLDRDVYRDMVHPDDYPAVVEALKTAIRTGDPFSYSHRTYLPDGRTERTFECCGEVIHDATRRPTRIMASARDVTEEHRTRRELAYLADHDPLTGVANRRRVTARLAESAAEGGGALLLIDVDHFKDINDLRGHMTGDRVLRRIVAVVSGCAGPEALVGRLGGDEFAVLLPGHDLAKALRIAEELCNLVAATPILDDGPPLRVTVSIGVGEIRADAEVTLAEADLALYEAKNAGRGRVRVFTPDQYHQAVHRVSLLQRIDHALGSGTMELDAQPIVSLATGRPRSLELLIRMRDGIAPAVGPAVFLPAIERTDLVLRLDRWVLGRAVRALAEPRARALDLHFEVNLSARSLEDPELGTWLLATLHEAGVAPSRLGIEITETAAISSVDDARTLAEQLIGAGCSFSLDDFGAGFGSFSHLKYIPFTAVKIAGEFVRDVDVNRVDRALVTAVVGVARELGMRTVAEQAERPAVLETLRNMGVDDGQSFRLGRPRPLRDLLGP